MPIDPNFRKQVRDVLEHLYDTAYLETHPLLAQLTGSEPAGHTPRAQKLRGLIKDLIESLRPQQNLPTNAPEWRSYRALRLRFVQGMPGAQVEAELGVSVRQLQREFHKGIDAMAALLWELRTTGAEPVAAAAHPPEPAEFDELQQELDQWSFQRHACEVRTLLDDVLWMVNPLLEQQHTTLELALPANLPAVLVDATLTRQALLKLIRMLLPEAPVHLALSAHAAASAVEVVLSDPLGRDHTAHPDWRIAALLCDQQGGRLRQEHAPDPTGPSRIVITLPGLEQQVVLVVDDNPALHQLFERYLATTRYAVIHAYNGGEALELAAAKHPDFITLDVMMAAVDGWQVLRSLQNDPRTSGIPVVVCSVLREPELALALGARAYLKKPVERLQLQAVLDRLQAAGSSSAAAPLPPPANS